MRPKDKPELGEYIFLTHTIDRGKYPGYVNNVINL